MTTNKMNPKKKYAKPTVKLAKWELNEAICNLNNVANCSDKPLCFDIPGGNGAGRFDIRDSSDGWSRVGSNSSSRNAW